MTAQTQITTEIAIGHIIFGGKADADAFVAEMVDLADAGETFVVEPYQGNRFHVARYFNGAFEAYC